MTVPAASRRDGARGAALVAELPVLLALLAEASWIAVFAGLLDALVLHGPVSGIPEMLVAAILGLVAGRRLTGRPGGVWPPAIGLAVLAGAAGWLSSGEVRAILVERGTGGLEAALGANPGGWLAGVAFVRGVAHSELPMDPNRIATTLVLAIPGIAIAAIVGGMIAEPWRSLFLATAQVQVLVFLASAVLALALARLSDVGGTMPIDWRRNPGWLALAGILVVGTAAVAAWVALAVGHAIALALYALLVPLLVAGFVLGFDRRSIRILLVSVAILGVLGPIVRFFAPADSAGVGTASLVPPAPPAENDASMGIAAAAFVVILLVVAIALVVIARFWLRRSPPPGPDADEERVIDPGGARESARPARRSGRFRRRARPADAVAAYRALLADLEGRPPVARAPGETPAEHARRLRGAGHGGLALDLLAADYGLARFGGEALTAAEQGRAIARADRLRRALLRVPIEVPEPVTVAGAGANAGDPVRGLRGGRRGAGAGADLPDADEPGALGSILTRIRRGP